MSNIIKNTIKPKKCKVCSTTFTPFLSTQVVCNISCAIKQAEKIRKKSDVEIKKADRKKTTERKLALKSRSDWLRDAQIIFNRFIRMRDDGLNCISCAKPMHKKVNAGHYLSVGSHPELRFNELNCHAQCEHCNSWLSGNAIEYRKNLIQKIGVDLVEWLESKHEPKKYTIEQIKELILTYKQKIKALNI